MKSKYIFQIDALKKSIFRIYVPVSILLLSIKLVSSKKMVAIELFTRDPASILTSQEITPIVNANLSPFIGAISQIGILFWSISASLCIFCSVVIYQKENISKKLAHFLSFFGCLTTLLLFDDLFQLHESVIPSLFNIPQELTFLCYGVLIVWGILKFKTVIFKTEWIILLLSFLWFGSSVIVDLFEIFDYFGYSKLLIEDGFKLFGIVSWCYYFSIICLKSIKQLN